MLMRLQGKALPRFDFDDLNRTCFISSELFKIPPRALGEGDVIEQFQRAKLLQRIFRRFYRDAVYDLGGRKIVSFRMQFISKEQDIVQRNIMVLRKGFDSPFLIEPFSSHINRGSSA